MIWATRTTTANMTGQFGNFRPAEQQEKDREHNQPVECAEVFHDASTYQNQERSTENLWQATAQSLD
jgi:hypothetical protein